MTRAVNAYDSYLGSPQGYLRISNPAMEIPLYAAAPAAGVISEENDFERSVGLTQAMADRNDQIRVMPLKLARIGDTVTIGTSLPLDVSGYPLLAAIWRLRQAKFTLGDLVRTIGAPSSGVLGQTAVYQSVARMFPVTVYDQTTIVDAARSLLLAMVPEFKSSDLEHATTVTRNTTPLLPSTVLALAAARGEGRTLVLIDVNSGASTDTRYTVGFYCPSGTLSAAVPYLYFLDDEPLFMRVGYSELANTNHLSFPAYKEVRGLAAPEIVRIVNGLGLGSPELNYDLYAENYGRCYDDAVEVSGYGLAVKAIAAGSRGFKVGTDYFYVALCPDVNAPAATTSDRVLPLWGQSVATTCALDAGIEYRTYFTPAWQPWVSALELEGGASGTLVDIISSPVAVRLHWNTGPLLEVKEGDLVAPDGSDVISCFSATKWRVPQDPLKLTRLYQTALDAGVVNDVLSAVIMPAGDGDDAVTLEIASNRASGKETSVWHRLAPRGNYAVPEFAALVLSATTGATATRPDGTTTALTADQALEAVEAGVRYTISGDPTVAFQVSLGVSQADINLFRSEVGSDNEFDERQHAFNWRPTNDHLSAAFACVHFARPRTVLNVGFESFVTHVRYVRRRALKAGAVNT